jgi:TRAP-type C4-dicarboxylate transport system permease small subunit
MSPHAVRVREIRRRVAIVAVACFLLAFNVIAWFGSMGTTSTSSASTSSSSSQTTTADEPAAVTTQQS